MIGGRSAVFQRTVPRARSQPFVREVVSACAAEGFEGASWPIGVDLTWEEGHGANAYAYDAFNASFPRTDGSDPNYRTLSVVDGELAIAAPPDAGLNDDGGSGQVDLAWQRVWGLARATTELSGPDMRVTGVVSGRSSGANGFPEWLLLARSAPNVDDFMSALFQLGYLAYFMDGYVQVEVWYVDGSTTLNGYAFLDSGIAVVPSIAVDDELALEVTGTGATTRVVCQINGVTYLDHDATSIGSAMSPDTVDMLPDGTRAGVGFYHIGASSGGTQQQDETFNGAYDLSWGHPIAGGCETISGNALTLSANDCTGGIISTADGPHIGGAAQIVDLTTASTFDNVDGNKCTILALVGGTDSSDWTGIGLEMKCTANAQVKDFTVGFLDPGDPTGTLVDGFTFPTNVFTVTGLSQVSLATLQLIVKSAPDDGSGNFEVIGLWRGFTMVNVTLTAGSLVPGQFRWGMLLFSPTGTVAGSRAAIDSASAHRPASEEVWDRADDNDTRYGSWEACSV